MNQQMLMGRKILVIDESPEITRGLADVFADAGARVTESHRGKDAMQFIAWGGYDLIFVPVATAEPDGSQIMEFITQSRPELLRRTVVLTTEQLDQQAQARLQYRYCSCLFLPLYHGSLVSYAVRALAFSEQRCAA